jgi:hypothetical protein
VNRKLRHRTTTTYIKNSFKRIQAKNRQTFNFITNPKHNLRWNIKHRILELDKPKRSTNVLELSKKLHTTLSRPTNTKCHNLCLNQALVPPVLLQTLGLGLNFCISNRKPTENYDLLRFARDVRTKITMADAPPSDIEYIPRLYIKSRSWNPPKAPKFIEKAISDFQKELNDLQTHTQQTTKNIKNLTKTELQRLKNLRLSKSLIVVPTDKNLGPAILEKQLYIRKALQEHLLNPKHYKQVTYTDAVKMRENTFYEIYNLIIKNPFKKEITAADKQYFNRALFYNRSPQGPIIPPSEKDCRIPDFYLLPKIHKQPWKTRPVVAAVGSINEVLSRWIDVQLQKVIHLCPSRIKDTDDLIHQLRQLPKLSSSAYITTIDAVSMYTNINTDHGIDTIEKWFLLHQHDLPPGFPTKTIVHGLAIVMKQLVFNFGDTYWKQQSGTAMGTSSACAYATIYYSFHEEQRIIIKQYLSFYKRFIDDALSITDKPTTHQQRMPDPTRDLIDETNNFTEDTFQDLLNTMNDFGEKGNRLEWEATTPSRTVQFLDLTISIDPQGFIHTQTYQKPMNLYLYLPASSAHPPGMLKGLIYGVLGRYHRHNKDRDDFLHYKSLLYTRLLARGYQPAQLDPLFTEATNHLDCLVRTNSSLVRKHTHNTENSLFLHGKFHHTTVPRATVQKLFQRTCVKPFTDFRNQFGQQLGLNKLTIAFSRLPNINDKVRRAKLTATDDEPVASSFIPSPNCLPPHTTNTAFPSPTPNPNPNPEKHN